MPTAAPCPSQGPHVSAQEHDGAHVRVYAFPGRTRWLLFDVGRERTLVRDGPSVPRWPGDVVEHPNARWRWPTAMTGGLARSCRFAILEGRGGHFAVPVARSLLDRPPRLFVPPVDRRFVDGHDAYVLCDAVYSPAPGMVHLSTTGMGMRSNSLDIPTAHLLPILDDLERVRSRPLTGLSTMQAVDLDHVGAASLDEALRLRRA